MFMYIRQPHGYLQNALYVFQGDKGTRCDFIANHKGIQDIGLVFLSLFLNMYTAVEVNTQTLNGNVPVMFYLQKKNQYELLWQLGIQDALKHTFQGKIFERYKTKMKEKWQSQRVITLEKLKRGKLAPLLFLSFQIQVSQFGLLQEKNNTLFKENLCYFKSNINSAFNRMTNYLRRNLHYFKVLLTLPLGT